MTRMLAAIIGLLLVLGQGAPAQVAETPYVPVPPKPGESRHPVEMEKNRKLCEQNDAKACAYYGDAIYVTAIEGNLTKSMKSAEVASMTATGYTFKDRACLLGEDYTCSALGYAYQYGHGVKIDMGLAYGYFAIACKGMPEYCKNRDDLSAYASPAAIKMAKQREQWTKQAPTPVKPVQIATTGNAKPEAKVTDANQLYGLGNAAYERKNFVSARDYYNKSCLAGRGASCGTLGLMYQSGEGGEKDATKAFSLLKKGCAAKDGFYCTYVGHAYANGEGTKKDTKAAKKYYKMGCALADQMGCVSAK